MLLLTANINSEVTELEFLNIGYIPYIRISSCEEVDDNGNGQENLGQYLHLVGLNFFQT